MRKKPIGKLISHLYRRNQKILSRKMTPYGIGSGGQHSFLKLILQRPGITQEQLTNELKFDKATTARSVKQLEESGYIERETDPNDRRSYLLSPTVKALDFSPVLQGILDEFNADLVQNLSDEEEDLLIALLQKISIDPGE
ncbi:MarR family winged helix-turn-helix transcriptional regulator [Paenibacillus sp. 23TSA30-6]|uniref:MarR family winged helix-turn-helix transcriptional regulator n=1 Tax=Paenibacillus sp. 23TSA30-6 TaxID=2546104 RepID=UPI001788300F|nr:MarR family transcriptional regulator [Paenibacillus sp. 23TSA30-6]MBE0338385.1 MarR family transcriptional regulator [Paenibacillus sp. 23TSA30-6]